jgi:hypothetical protein
MPTAAEKAQTHFAALPTGRGDAPTLEWEQDGITFAIYDPYVTPDGNGIGVTVEAVDINGVLPTDNPYQFFNPPLGLVTQEEVGEWQIVGGAPTHVITTTQVVDSSDPNATLQRIIYDAVVLRARQLGWSP